MNALFEMLSSELVVRLGWTLVHSLWQGAAVAGVLAVLLYVLPARRPNVRYGAGCGALLAIVGLTVITFVLVEAPRSPAVVGPRAVPRAEVVAVGPVGEVGAMPVGTPGEGMESPTAGEREAHAISVRPEKSVAVEPVATTSSWRESLAARARPMLPWLVGAWLVGVFVLSIWRLGGTVAVQRLKVAGTGPVSEEITAMVRRCGERLRVSRPVRVLRSCLIGTPAVLGHFRPVILLPVGALTGLSSEQIEAIIAHELAHIRRCDYLVNALQTVVETLFFHQPAVWWISRRVRIEREYCCDDAVVRVTSNRLVYARALVDLAPLPKRLTAVAARGEGGSLVARIRRLVDPLGRPDVRVGRSALGLMMVGVVAVALACTMWRAPAVGQTSDGAKETPTSAPSAADGLEWGPVVKGVRLGAAAAAPIQDLKEQVRIQYTLENGGSKAIRFYGGPSNAILSGMHLWAGGDIQVFGPDGQQVWPTRSAGFVSGGIDVEPGQTYTGAYDLSRHFEFKQPGEYRVTFQLRPHSADDPSGHDSFVVSGGEFVVKVAVEPRASTRPATLPSEWKDGARLDKLIQALKDPDRGVSEEAARRLGELRDPRAVAPLAETYRARRYKSFLEALQSLGRIGGPQAQAVLVEALNDGDRMAREIAASRLKDLGWKPTNRRQKVQYLLALRKWEEALAAGPTTKPVPATSNQTEGTFELDIPILVALRLNDAQVGHGPRDVVVQFKSVDGRPSAVVNVDFSTWPRTKWLFEIELLDASGGVLGHAKSEYSTSGMIMRVPFLDPAEIPVRFGQGVDSAKVARFRFSMYSVATDQGNPLKLDEELPLSLGLETVEGWRSAEVTWVRFEQREADRVAEVHVKLLSWPKAKWRTRVELQDAQGGVVARAEQIVESAGVISSYPLMSEQMLTLDLGKQASYSTVARYAVFLERVLDESAHAAAEPGEEKRGPFIYNVQTRVRPDKRAWAAGETPALKAEVESRWKVAFQTYLSSNAWELEVDGQWYQCRVPPTAPPDTLRPGQHIKDIAFVLDKDLWRRQGSDEALELTPGVHTIRVAFPFDAFPPEANPFPDRHAEIVRAVSNAVEIELASTGTAPATRPAEAGLSGEVFTPDGKPAAGAQVVLVPPGQMAWLDEGRFTRFESSDGKRVDPAQYVISADGQGRFAFDRALKGYVIIALHDAGVAHVPTADLSRTRRIELEAWGRIEGTILKGGTPAIGSLTEQRAYVATGRGHDVWQPDASNVNHNWTAKPGADGQFVIERVVPGYISGRGGLAELYCGYDWMKFLVRSGGTTRLTPETRCTITGQIVPWPMTATKPQMRGRSLKLTRTYSHPAFGHDETDWKYYGEQEGKMAELKQQVAGEAYANPPQPADPAGQLDADGVFTLAGLLPGQYQLMVSGYEGAFTIQAPVTPVSEEARADVGRLLMWPIQTAKGEGEAAMQSPSAPTGKVAWGEEQDGLRAGVELASGVRAYQPGELVGVRFWVENVSDHPILVVGDTGRDDPVEIMNADGRPVTAWNEPWHAAADKIEVELGPGGRAYLGVSLLDTRSNPAEGQLSSFGRRPGGFSARPGAYRVRYAVYLPDLKRTGAGLELEARRPGAWRGIVKTGWSELIIAE